MSALGPDERALVLRHLAALRRSGVAAPAAVRQVAAALPAGEAKQVLASVADALDRGETGDGASDPFVAIVARGESAIPEVLDAAAESYALHAAVQAATQVVARRVVFVLLVLGAFGVLLFPVTGEFKQMFSGFGMALPVPTQFVLDSRVALLVLGLVALAGAVGVFLRPGLVTGWLERKLDVLGTTRIGLASAASAAGLDEARALTVAGFTPDPSGSLSVLGLSRVALESAEWVRATQGFSRATAFAATGGAAHGQQRLRLIALASEVGVVVVLGATVGLMLISLYLPIFAVAGSVQ